METGMVRVEYPSSTVVEQNASSVASAIARLKLSGENAANFIRIASSDAQKAAFLLALSHERNGYSSADFAKVLSSLAPREVQQEQGATMRETVEKWAERKTAVKWTKTHKHMTDGLYAVMALIMATLVPGFQLDNFARPWSWNSCFRYGPGGYFALVGAFIGLAGMIIAVLAQYKRNNEKLWLSTCGLSALAACLFIFGSFTLGYSCNPVFMIQLGINITSMIGVIMYASNIYVRIRMEKSKTRIEPEPEVVTAEGARSEV
mmetsp:Transcript_25066/g.63064  ORF Transcript_25066/g.63064 Transcript_25066/m.63064 type:complete len:262 (-) Transcript_25066:36-821(-)